MRVLIALMIGMSTLVAGTDSLSDCAQGNGPGDCKSEQGLVTESPGDPPGTAADQAAAATASPWQGTWTGSETNSFGTKHPLRVKLRVSNGKLSGSWHVQSAGLKPITGQINGKEAAISILQGGSMVKATLVDDHTFKFSGIRGYGTLAREEKDD